MTSDVPTIPGQVAGGGPTFDMPHPEATDTTEQEDTQDAWFSILSGAVGK